MGACDFSSVTCADAAAKKQTTPAAPKTRQRHPRGMPAARSAIRLRSRRNGMGARQVALAREPLAWHLITAYVAESSALAGRNRMANRESALIEITPEVLLKAYACGIFPMAESAEDPALFWIEPEKRGVIPLDRFHVSTRLARTVRSERFSIATNRDFDGVLDGCADPQPGRARTWINTRIRTLYQKLYNIGHCHSIEAYDDGVLAGGLY